MFFFKPKTSLQCLSCLIRQISADMSTFWCTLQAASHWTVTVSNKLDSKLQKTGGSAADSWILGVSSRARDWTLFNNLGLFVCTNILQNCYFSHRFLVHLHLSAQLPNPSFTCLNTALYIMLDFKLFYWETLLLVLKQHDTLQDQ